MTTGDIQRWIDGDRDYAKGVLLYEHFGKNETMKKLFLSGPAFYKQKMLQEELKLIYAAGVKVSAPVKGESFIREKKKKAAIPALSEFKVYSERKKPIINFDELPEHLKKKFILKGELYKRADYLRYRLDTLQTDEDRFESAHTIISCMDQVQKIWRELDQWHATRNTIKSSLPDDRAQIQKAIINLASQISKAKKKNQLAKAEALETKRNLLKKKLENGAVQA